MLFHAGWPRITPGRWYYGRDREFWNPEQLL